MVRTVEAYPESHDPVMEPALIEAGAPREIFMIPQKSRLLRALAAPEREKGKEAPLTLASEQRAA